MRILYIGFEKFFHILTPFKLLPVLDIKTGIFHFLTYLKNPHKPILLTLFSRLPFVMQKKKPLPTRNCWQWFFHVILIHNTGCMYLHLEHQTSARQAYPVTWSVCTCSRGRFWQRQKPVSSANPYPQPAAHYAPFPSSVWVTLTFQYFLKVIHIQRLKGDYLAYAACNLTPDIAILD